MQFAAGEEELHRSEIPKSKIQIPNKSQTPKLQWRGPTSSELHWNWGLGVWSLFGIWILDFGFSVTPKFSPPSNAAATAQESRCCRLLVDAFQSMPRTIAPARCRCR